MEPNNVASMLRLTRRNNALSTRPSAKLAVVMTPMAASAPMMRRLVTRPMARPVANPHTPAPMKKLKPTAALTAAPPKMECDSP